MSRVPLRVLIVDDHVAYRDAAVALLQDEGLEVVGSVGDGESAFVEVERLRPDVVLVDVQLPGLDGFAVAERVARSVDPPAVVLISSREAATYGARVEDCSALGFIPKRGLTGAALMALLG